MNSFRAYVNRENVGDSGPLRFIAANEGRMADGFDLVMDGVQLDRFMANPVILWSHSYWQLPIGRAEDVQVDGSRLLMDVRFDTGDEFASKVDRKYRTGFMNAVSVGFDVLQVEPDQDGGRGGRVTSWELVETSAVPVPMDPGAVVESGRQALRALFDVNEPDEVLRGIVKAEIARLKQEEEQALQALRLEELVLLRDTLFGGDK